MVYYIVSVEGGENQYDLYALPDPSIVGTINSVRVYVRVRVDGGEAGDYFAYTKIKTHETEYDGSAIDLWVHHDFVTYSTLYSDNPNTTNPWTWTEINDLQAGVRLQTDTPYTFGAWVECTQVYVEVDYTPPVPLTVTTQDASDIIIGGGTLNGTITNDGGVTVNERGFVYDTESHGDPGDTDPDVSEYANNWTETNSFGVGVFERAVTGLGEGTLVYFRACAHNSEGWSYGAEQSFTSLTPPINPLISRKIVSRVIVRRTRIR